MTLQGFVRLQSLYRAKLLIELHLIILLMDAIMALTANINASVKLGFTVMFTEMVTAMQFARYKMVEGEHAGTLTQ